MGTATITINPEVLFEFMGLDYFDGKIEDVFMNTNYTDCVTIKISGNDIRLPES